MNLFMVDKIAIDANFLVALAYPDDPHNLTAEKVFLQLIKRRPIFIVNNYILAEAVTVILLRSKKMDKVKFLKKDILKKHSQLFRTAYIPANFNEKIYQVFIGQKKYKGNFLSFTDCSLIAQARRQGIRTIITFDETFKQFSKEFKIMGV